MPVYGNENTWLFAGKLADGRYVYEANYPKISDYRQHLLLFLCDTAPDENFAAPWGHSDPPDDGAKHVTDWLAYCRYRNEIERLADAADDKRAISKNVLDFIRKKLSYPNMMYHGRWRGWSVYVPCTDPYAPSNSMNCLVLAHRYCPNFYFTKLPRLLDLIFSECIWNDLRRRILKSTDIGTEILLVGGLQTSRVLRLIREGAESQTPTYALWCFDNYSFPTGAELERLLKWLPSVARQDEARRKASEFGYEYAAFLGEFAGRELYETGPMPPMHDMSSGVFDILIHDLRTHADAEDSWRMFDPDKDLDKDAVELLTQDHQDTEPVADESSPASQLEFDRDSFVKFSAYSRRHSISTPDIIGIWCGVQVGLSGKSNFEGLIKKWTMLLLGSWGVTECPKTLWPLILKEYCYGNGDASDAHITAEFLDYAKFNSGYLSEDERAAFDYEHFFIASEADEFLDHHQLQALTPEACDLKGLCSVFKDYVARWRSPRLSERETRRLISQMTGYPDGEDHDSELRKMQVLSNARKSFCAYYTERGISSPVLLRRLAAARYPYECIFADVTRDMLS